MSCSPWTAWTSTSAIPPKEAPEQAYDEARDAHNRLYYCEHEDLWGIEAEFLELSGDDDDGPLCCRLKFTATARDVNHYDGSKPDTVVMADAWFGVPDVRPGY